MTRRERAQVVELLRCAADLAASDNYSFMGPASDVTRALKPLKSIRTAATKAVVAVARERRNSTVSARNVDQYVSHNLEAAQRVEEGWSP
jgi:hypothetical protein